ncbi:MAG: amidase, partial [Bryobacteraceae bacterium]|nr:amidase [Bryobacteraceae bacterium]
MLNHLPLVRMSELIRTKQITSEELVEAHLAQIDRVDGDLKSFVMTFPSEIRAEARRAGWEPAEGPLHGIPVSIKDSFDVRSYPTLCGSKLRLRHHASHDSTAVARLRAAGALLIGKTNCPEFLLNYETDNFITGWTANPWNQERSAGGSSGGEAAAISSYCSPGGIGSDGGGSIRVPAHFCGIAGLKPTPGRISAAGHIPEISYPSGLLGVAGPMARSAEDLRLLFSVLAGYDLADPFSAPVPLRKPDLADMQIGVASQFCDIPVEDCMSEAVARAARIFERDLQLPVAEFSFEGFETVPDLWWFFFTELFAPLIRELIEALGPDAHWTGSELIDEVPADLVITGRNVVEKLAIRDKMRLRLLQRMQKTPVILMPVCSVPAFRHKERKWTINGTTIGLRDAVACVTPFNLLGLPAVTIPFGKAKDGMPVGIQLVGQPYSEEILLDLAIKLEQCRG